MCHREIRALGVFAKESLVLLLLCPKKVFSTDECVLKHLYCSSGHDVSCLFGRDFFMSDTVAIVLLVGMESKCFH